MFGGGRWIRTTEGIASRFTVCPLWPLGNSPILTSLLKEVGAGRRTRTPDLLITKMRLYVYCAHFVPVLSDTSNFSVSFRAINLRSIKAFFARWRQGWRQMAFHYPGVSTCRGQHFFLCLLNRLHSTTPNPLKYKKKRKKYDIIKERENRE